MKRSFLLPLFFLSLLVSFSTEADLILQREEKIEDLIGEDGEYEGSGCSLRDSVDELVVVLDNSDRLLIVDTDLDDARWETSSSGMEGFEGVTYDYQGSDLGDDEIFSVMESVEDDDGDYQAILYTFDSDFSLLGTQRLGGVEFESDNKGFEGLTLIRYEDGEESTTSRYLLALCEGNSCAAGDEGRDEGNGRILVYAETSDYNWEYIDTISLPSSVDFQDYSGMDVDGNVIAIVSQEESKLWIGKLAVREDDDFYIQGSGNMYNFPRDSDGDIVYCNIEGITFIQGHELFPNTPENCLLIAAVSDKAKSDQPDRCGDKAESVHIFNIPEDDDDDNDNNNDDDDGSAAYLLYPSAVVGLVGVMVQTVMWLW